MRYPILATLLLAATAASAQTARTVRPTQLWPELQAEFALHSGDYLVVGLRGERTTTDGYARRLGFDSRRISLAYEHFWNTKWSWGATAYFASNSNSTTIHPEVRNITGEYVVPGLLLRHRSPVFGGLTFGQRLSLERITPISTNYLGGSGPDGEFWARLRVDLAKDYPVGSLTLRPRLSYEAYTHLRFQKADADPDERTIQFTSLRAEVGLRLSPAFDLTPWFAYQTGYGVSLPQYDKNGNQVRGGNYNDVYPTVGLDLRYTLGSAGAKPDRQQLPTQH